MVRLSAAKPPDNNFYPDDIPGNHYKPYAYLLRSLRHLGRAHSAFLSVCITAAYRADDDPLPQLGDTEKSARTIEDFILHPLAWDQKLHSLNYLMTSRDLVEGIATGTIAPARSGAAQHDTIKRLVATAGNPYTQLPTDFVKYLAT